MIGALTHFTRRCLRDRYPGPWAIVGELVAALGGLAIYWYTSKAFAPIVPGLAGGDYFSYLVIGEAALYLPLALLNGVAVGIRAAASDGTLEALLVMPIRPQTPALLLEAATVTRETLRVAGLLALAALAGLRAPGEWYAGALLLQLASLPAFFGLGLFAGAIVVRFGRGDSMLAFAGTAASLAAGAYFPTAVFPESFRALAGALSPFSLLLGATRDLFAAGIAGTAFLHACLGLAGWGLFLLPLGYVALGAAFGWVRRVGSPLVFTS